MQQEITPTFTENELLELLAVLDDAIWTRGECSCPRVLDQDSRTALLSYDYRSCVLLD
ncbi:hypothetical protein PI125_g13251 [Phytophthora idaei]|nr:hypothetical protein PI125_g13251 [Phytophthora idaei]KAG3148830.1 hypothetical protein PI126_g12290 [Phytophthora idaei]